MKLPLRAVPVTDVWVGLWDNNERRICALYSDYALTDAAVIVAAVNNEAALRAEVERLRAIAYAAETVIKYALDMGNYWYARGRDIDALQAALAAGKEATE